MDAALEMVAKAGPRALTPDLPRELMRSIAQSRSFQLFRSAAAYCARRRQAALHEEMAALGRYNQEHEAQARDGLGEHLARVSQEVYLQMRVLYGDDCWNDPGFVREFLRDNPACKVRTTRGTRGQEYGGQGKRPTSNVQRSTFNGERAAA